MPQGQPARLLPAVLMLGAVSTLAQVVSGHPQSLVRALDLAVAAACLGSAAAALRGLRISAGVRLGITGAIQTSFLTQLTFLFFARLPASGGGRELVAVLGWSPVVLITTWLLVEEASDRRLAIAAYFLVAVIPATALWAARGPEAAWAAFIPTAVLVLAGATVTVVLAEIVRLREQLAESRAGQEVLERMAHTDALTELPNRRSLMAELSREAAVAARFGLPLAVIEFDLDHFKEINDVYGHQTGDRVLAGVAGHVRRRLRATDIIGRLGGEEFLILAPGNSLAEATRLAEEICGSLREHPMAGDRAWVTGSFGVTVYEQGDTGDAILARADAALYAAKRDGRNRVATVSRDAVGSARASLSTRSS